MIKSTGIPARYNEGILTFLCGVVDHAGTYIFRMVREQGGRVLTTTPPMHVYWPRFLLRMPETHQALTSEISLEFSLEGGPARTVCSPANDNAVFSLELVYYGEEKEKDTGTEQVNSREKHVVTNQPIETFSTQKQSYVFPCHLFDQVGAYEVHLTTGYQPGMPIATSNPTQVRWRFLVGVQSQRWSILKLTTNLTGPF